jgi:hypothetical protein
MRFMKLSKKYGTRPRYARMPEDFNGIVKYGGEMRIVAEWVSNQ